MTIALNKMFTDIKPTPMVTMFEIVAKYKDLISLGVGEPDFTTDERIIDAAARAAKAGHTHYPGILGDNDLRTAISKYWADKYGLASTPDEVMVTVGATQSIFMILQTLIDPGDEVIVPSPYYTGYSQTIDDAHAKGVYIKCCEGNEFVNPAEQIERCITPRTKAVLLNSPNNPAGALLSREDALKISEVIIKHNLVLISDEVYEALIFDGEHICMATLPGMRERTFTVGSFSKAYAMCGWRVGYAIGPKAVVDASKVACIGTTMCMNSVGQRAALYAIENCGDFVEMMVESFRQRLDYAYERINSIKGLSCARPKATFYIFVNIKETGMKSMDFSMKLLEEARVAAIPGIAFGADFDDYIRFACTVPMDKLKVALDKIEAALNK